MCVMQAIKQKYLHVMDTYESINENSRFIRTLQEAADNIEKSKVYDMDASFHCRDPSKMEKVNEQIEDANDVIQEVNDFLQQDDDYDDMDDLMKELDEPEEGDLLEDQTPALPSVPSKKPSTTTPVKSRSIPASTAEEELEAQLNDL